MQKNVQSTTIDTQPEMSFGAINFIARKGLNITCHEYCVLYLIQQWSYNDKNKAGWCYASRSILAEKMCLTERYIYKIIKKFTTFAYTDRKGNKFFLLEKDSKTNYLRTTKEWDRLTNIKIAFPEGIIGGEKHSVNGKIEKKNDSNVSQEELPLFSKNKSKSNYSEEQPQFLDESLIEKPEVVTTRVHDLNYLIGLFKNINELNYKKFFQNKTQRGALQSVVDHIGYENTEALLLKLPEINKMKYVTGSFTPVELQYNYQKYKDKALGEINRRRAVHIN